MDYVKPSDLKVRWQNSDEIAATNKVVPFYSHTHVPYACFSNFYKHAPFDYTIKFGGFVGQNFPITFSEKAIMLTKASMFGDHRQFRQILECDDPAKVKKLGRGVKGFDDAVWNNYVCEIARDIVTAKFMQLPELAKILMHTRNAIIAEATTNDKIWAIGLSLNDPDVSKPSKWKGTNILGYALMEARWALRD